MKYTRMFLAFAGVAALGFTAVYGFNSLSVTDTSRPSFEHCSVNKQGSITGCSNDFSQGRIDGLLSYGETNVEAGGGGKFWVKVDYVKKGGDGFAPHFTYLFKERYLKESSQEKLSENPVITEFTMNDIKWSNDLRESLESGTVCSMQARPSTEGAVWYRYGTGDNVQRVKYHEDWYVDEPNEYRNIDKWLDTVSITADKVRFTKNDMYCRFDFEEIMEKGAEYTPFHSVRAFGPFTLKSDNYGDGYSKLSVDFEADSDGDGVINARDACPDVAGTVDGCLDSDGDGVTDDKDAAPNTPGSNSDGTPTLTEKIVQFFVSGWMQGEPLF